jgi:hypothetical protein
MIKFKPHYSGHLSRKFWREINSVKGYYPWGLMYSMGCTLQDLESRLLKELAELPKGKCRESAMRAWCDSKEVTLVIKDKRENKKGKGHTKRR